MGELGEYCEGVLDSIEAQTSSDYVASSRAKTRETGFLHLPETRLVKVCRQLQIFDRSSTATKMLRFNFDKRVLEKEYLYSDVIPSYAFGTRDDDETFAE